MKKTLHFFSATNVSDDFNGVIGTNYLALATPNTAFLAKFMDSSESRRDMRDRLGVFDCKCLTIQSMFHCCRHRLKNSDHAITPTNTAVRIKLMNDKANKPFHPISII